VYSNKSIVIHNGFDFERINDLQPEKNIRREFNITTKYVIGMVGRFLEDKDYATFIRSANSILKNNDAITFLCIGQGDSGKYKILVEPRFIDRINFLAQQEDVESIMKICDIGILATYTEGIPNTILEFMALGKPVIVTYGGGSKELVINEGNGYLIPPKSPQILAEKIKYLLDNPKIADKFGSAGQKRITEHFNIDKMVNEFTSTYHELVYA
jgi:glycosyltransferase involved in cell wall biosynthesis